MGHNSLCQKVPKKTPRQQARLSVYKGQSVSWPIYSSYRVNGWKLTGSRTASWIGREVIHNTCIVSATVHESLALWQKSANLAAASRRRWFKSSSTAQRSAEPRSSKPDWVGLSTPSLHAGPDLDVVCHALNDLHFGVRHLFIRVVQVLEDLPLWFGDICPLRHLRHQEMREEAIEEVLPHVLCEVLFAGQRRIHIE